jgi:predicted RNase H-like HicB family nuclease
MLIYVAAVDGNLLSVDGQGPAREERRSPRSTCRSGRSLYTPLMDLARTLTAAVSKDGEWYVARCLEVEVTSQGESVDDALAALREALELYFEDDEVPASETLGSILSDRPA